MKRFILMVLAALCMSANADIGAGAPIAPAAPNYNMPPGKFFINPDLIPKRRFGQTTERVTPTVDAPGFGASPKNGGDFRVSCGFSHAAFDDPIVFPGQSGKTHLHQFFGNTSTRSASDIANMATTGKSTCFGGTANRSGYWVPVLVYHCPAGSTNGCTRARDGEPQFATDSNFYYKSSEDFGSDFGSYGNQPVQWPPIGFRMIKGDASSLVGGGGEFVCFVGTTVTTVRLNSIPTTAQATAQGCDNINFLIGMAQCWDGVNIDSPNHQSHMSIAAFNFSTGCTDPAFPIMFPAIVFNVHTNVNIADLNYLRLSSDRTLADSVADTVNCNAGNNFCAGFSIHADYVNGWSNNPNFNGWGKGSITDIIKRNCWLQGKAAPTGKADCHNHLLGDVLGNGTNWTLF